MNQNHLEDTQEQSSISSLGEPEWQQICMRVLLRDGFHCRICKARGNLKCHTRLDCHECSQMHDVMALCEKCYELAQRRKQKRMQGKRSHFLCLACYICLLLTIVAIIMVLSYLLPLTLFLLTFAGISAAYLLEVLYKRWF